MENMEEKLTQVLSNPEELAKVMSIASSFLSTQAQNEPSAVSPHAEESAEQATFSFTESEDTASQPAGDMAGAAPAMASLLQMIGKAGLSDVKYDKNKLDLLMAIRPFLKEPRQKHIDRVCQLVKMSHTAKAAVKSFADGGGKTDV